jgi:TRAP-type transport system periplasmic protein
MRKVAATAAMALIILLAASSLYAGGQGDSAEEPVVRFRLAHVQAERSPTGQGTYRFAELVEEYTDGTVTIEVFPASQLGNNSEIFSSVQTGAVDMSITPFPVMADIVPELSIYLAGYFFESHEQQMRVLNHPDYGQAWNQRLVDEGGLRVVGTMLYGFRTLTTTDTPVYSPDDLSGLRLRAVPNTMSLAVARGLGGEPTSVAFAELFEALRQGVVDAQENPLPTIKSNNFNEVQEYLILTRHQLVSLPWVINEASFQQLSENQQEALLRAAAEAGEYTTELTLAEEETLVDELEAGGMTVIGVEDGLDLEAFRNRVQAEVMRAFADEWPEGLAEEVLALVGN